MFNQLLEELFDISKNIPVTNDLALQPKYVINKGWFELMVSVAKDYHLIEQDKKWGTHQLISHKQLDVRLARQIIYKMVEETSNVLLATKVAKYITPFSFGTLSIVLWTSPSIRTLMQNLSNYDIMFGSPIRLHIHETIMGDMELWFSNTEPHNEQINITFIGLIVFISTIIHIIRINSYEVNIPLDIFINEKNIYKISNDDIKKTYNCNIKFDSVVTKIRVPRKYLDSSLINSDNDIYNTNLILLRKQVSIISSDNIIIRIYTILDNMVCLLNLSNIILASKMNMSIRTLNRRLADIGTNYRCLLDKYKLERSIRLLHQQNINMTEIAYQLGFSDLSTFSRAFKRWTGVSPSKMDF